MLSGACSLSLYRYMEILSPLSIGACTSALLSAMHLMGGTMITIWAHHYIRLGCLEVEQVPVDGT